MASIHSEEDNTAAFEICPGNHGGTQDNTVCWIGSNNDVLSWTDGSPVDYTDWHDGRPRAGQYACVALWGDAWADVDCILFNDILPLCNNPSSSPTKSPSDLPSITPSISPSMHPSEYPTTTLRPASNPIVINSTVADETSVQERFTTRIPIESTTITNVKSDNSNHTILIIIVCTVVFILGLLILVIIMKIRNKEHVQQKEATNTSIQIGNVDKEKDSQVRQFLVSIDPELAESCYDKFIANGWNTMKSIYMMDNEDLKQMDILPGHRKLILSHIQDVRHKEEPLNDFNLIKINSNSFHDNNLIRKHADEEPGHLGENEENSSSFVIVGDDEGTKEISSHQTHSRSSNDNECDVALPVVETKTNGKSTIGQNSTNGSFGDV